MNNAEKNYVELVDMVKKAQRKWLDSMDNNDYTDFLITQQALNNYCSMIVERLYNTGVNIFDDIIFNKGV